MTKVIFKFFYKKRVFFLEKNLKQTGPRSLRENHLWFFHWLSWKIKRYIFYCFNHNTKIIQDKKRHKREGTMLT